MSLQRRFDDIYNDLRWYGGWGLLDRVRHILEDEIGEEIHSERYHFTVAYSRWPPKVARRIVATRDQNLPPDFISASGRKHWRHSTVLEFLKTFAPCGRCEICDRKIGSGNRDADDRFYVFIGG